MPGEYNWPSIRSLLLQGFTEQQLRLFCFDEPDFQPLYPDLADSDSQAEIVQRLLEYADKTVKTETLLAWAQEQNPARFEKHQPYYRSAPTDSDSLAGPEAGPSLDLDKPAPWPTVATDPSPQPPQPLSPGFRYHVFVSYSQADRSWVQADLAPALEAAGLRVCLDYRDFEPAAPFLTEVEKAVTTSQKTLLVLTPAYLDSEWAEFGNLMLQTLDPAARKRRLVPLLKAPCTLPPRLAFLVPINFVDPAHRGLAWRQLIDTLGGQPGLSPLLSPWQSFYRRLRRFWLSSSLLATSLLTLGLVTVVILLLLFIWAAIAPPPPAPAPGPTPVTPIPGRGFNIAVAPFTVLDQTGHFTVTEESLEVSRWLFDVIEQEARQLPRSLSYEVRGPNDVEPVVGAAAEVANRHHATLLIYGVVTNTRDSHLLQPEFYISEQGFGYGSEVVGANRLGQAVPFEPPLGEPGTLSAINEKLDARAQALRYLVQGLALFYIGREAGDYNDAYNLFEDAITVPNWLPQEGQEVVHLLMGAAMLRFYNDPKTSLEERTQALGQAEQAFTQAALLNPHYARSYLGLGAVALQQATVLYPQWPDALDPKLLGEAERRYRQALAATDQPDQANVRARAHYGLGQIYLTGYAYDLAGWPETEAQVFFTRVIDDYEAAQPDRSINWFAGRAYASLAWLALRDEDENWPETVVDNCRQAIDILKELEFHRSEDQIAYCWAWQGQAQEALNNPTEACRAYRQAQQSGSTGGVPAEELKNWQDALERLEQGDCS